MQKISRLLIVLFTLGAMLWAPFSIGKAEAAACPTEGEQPASFSLDGVSLRLCTPFLPGSAFVASDPVNAIQVAYAIDPGDAGKEFSITAVPFGAQSSTEALPPADASTGEDTYLKALAAFRESQGGRPQAGPRASLFGREVASIQSVVNLSLDGITTQPVWIVEWVAKAGERLWIVRASQKLGGVAASQSDLQPLAQSIASTALSSDDLAQPSTSAAGENSPLAPAADPGQNKLAQAQGEASSLPTPPWWSGDCDTNHYANAPENPSHIAALPLGAVYRGLEACGPRPWADGAPDVLVHFTPQSWGEYEWECVELSMRFLYLAYGVQPYGANGNQVVEKYSGSRFIKIANGTQGMAPLPDDVLSYGATTPYGHTSVVTASNVDGNGNGSITVIEQNNSPTGASTLKVSNWTVMGDASEVVGWLHPFVVGSIKTYLPLTLR